MTWVGRGGAAREASGRTGAGSAALPSDLIRCIGLFSLSKAFGWRLFESVFYEGLIP